MARQRRCPNCGIKFKDDRGCPCCDWKPPLAIPSTSLLAAVLDIEKHWKDMQGPIRDAEHDEDGSMFKGDSYPRLHESFAQMWHAIERAKKAANATHDGRRTRRTVDGIVGSLEDGE